MNVTNHRVSVIASRLEELLKKTPTDMAKLFGISKQAWNQIKTKNVRLTEKQIAAFAEAFPGTDKEWRELCKRAAKRT